jgi:hypothetical protein
VPPLSKPPAPDKREVGGNEESYVTEGTITFGDDPPPAKPAVSVKPAVPRKTTWSAPRPQPAAPLKPVEGTLTLTPPPPSKPSTPVTLSAPPPKAAAAPTATVSPKPTVPPAVQLKERLQGICGPAYEVRVMPRKNGGLLVNIVGGRDEEDGKRLMDRITPVLKSPEFKTLDTDVDIVVPSK